MTTATLHRSHRHRSAISSLRLLCPSSSMEARIFAGLLALYLLVAVWLVFGNHSVMEDALSRVANAGYVLYSREPKLANIGFVWTPLPSLLVLPFLPLRSVWPELIERGFPANILSAVAMAGAGRVLYALLGDLRVPPRVAVLLTVAFGLQPMVIWFGANGMTEALLIVFVLLSGRRLVHWLNDDDFRHLAAAGSYLALGYLARYEVLASGCAAVTLVAAMSWWRTPGGRLARRHALIADVLLVGAPLAAAFLFWAVASWIIVGHPFEQFSSAYGNTALIEREGAKGALDATLLPVQLLILAPTLPVVLIAAVTASVRRRDLRVVPPAALLVSVLAFEGLVYAAGSLFGFLRYQIAVIPLLVVLAGCIFQQPAPSVHVPAPAAPLDDASTIRLSWTVSKRGRRFLPAAASILVIPGMLTSGCAFMTQPEYANQEWGHVRPAIFKMTGSDQSPRDDSNGVLDIDYRIAAYLDAQRLPPGSVIIDCGSGYAIVTASANPRQFVITSDTDFHGALIDPVGHHIRYMLLNRNRSYFDAVASTWPDLVANAPTSAWARRDVVFPSSVQPGTHEWTLWRVET